MTVTDLRAGDTVLLKDGKQAVVDSPLITSYTDREGEHLGPFVGLKDGYRHVRLEEVVAKVASNPHSCQICGGGVTSKDPEKYPYCRSCHYTGQVAEREHAEVISKLGSLLGADAIVCIEHTGGGCFWLAVRYDGSPFYWIATDGEASIPDFAKGASWGIVCRYADEEVAVDIDAGDGSVWNEYEGLPLLGSEGYDDTGVGTLTHEQVAQAILADREKLREIGRLS